MDSPEQIIFTQNSLFVGSPVYRTVIKNNIVMHIEGGNCILEIDKVSLEIKRRIIGNNWISPRLLNIESNGNLQIMAWDYINNITKSDRRFLLNIYKNGKIITKVEIDGIQRIDDVLFVNNKIIITSKNKLKIFDS